MKNKLLISIFYFLLLNNAFTQNNSVGKTELLSLDFNGGLSIGVQNDHPKLLHNGVKLCNNMHGDTLSALEIKNSFSTLNTDRFNVNALYFPEFTVSFWFSPNENLNSKTSAIQKTILTNPNGVIDIFYKKGKLYANLTGENRADKAINEIEAEFEKNVWYFIQIDCKENAETVITINEDRITGLAMSDFKFAKFGPKIILGSSSIVQVTEPFNGKVDNFKILNYNPSKEETKTQFNQKTYDFGKPSVRFEEPNFKKYFYETIKVDKPKYQIAICVFTGLPITRFNLYNNDKLIGQLPIGRRSPIHHGCEYFYEGYIDLNVGENKITVECQSAYGLFEEKRLKVIYTPKANIAAEKIVEIKPKEQPKETFKDIVAEIPQKFEAEISLKSPKIEKNGIKNTTEDEVFISGIIKSKDNINEIKINGQLAEFVKVEGIFQIALKLKEGENKISISAFDNKNNKIDYPFTINRNSPNAIAKESSFKIEEANPVKDIGKRYALIIGNNNYAHTTKLANPINDAKLMASELQKLGFEVTKVENSTLKDISANIISFKNKLKDKANKGATGLFYYAGHGVQDAKNRNYLIPIEAELKDEDALESEAYDLERLLNHFVDANNKLNIIILDACRNNPFARKFRSGETGGLAEVKISAEGLFIAYATSPGRVADDGKEGNGLYTKEFVKELRKPNQKLEDVFKNTKANVYFESDKKQMPWETNFFIGDFWFNVK
jgi:Caspase domain/Concanavalin A-like lectin/glucanases superfamily